jgi:DNA-directed RNA polymerase specialized sigma24 family protein
MMRSVVNIEAAMKPELELYDTRLSDLMDGISDLDETHRMLISLHYLEELSGVQIAEVLGLPEDVALVLLEQAMRHVGVAREQSQRRAA